MPKTVLKFSIHGRLPGLNEVIQMNHQFRSRGGKRFYAYHDHKAEVEQRIAIALCSAVGSTSLRAQGPFRVEILWVEENERRDPDNVASGVKFILDALVRNGVLGGDSRKFISSLHHFFETDRSDPRVEVSLIKTS